jgi:YD repeat-containing protein
VLGRKTIQIDSDSVSRQTWSYSGNTVAYTDENLNQWKRTSDAYGNLTHVLEPNGVAQASSMQTDYAYNALNDLISVAQWGGPSGSSGGRGRWFTYDSLSRLLSATNPETGTINYTYDLNGNVSTKTDARNVVTTYGYDALNRVLSKTYSGDPSNTPFSCYQYDSPSVTNGIGRLSNSWTIYGSCATTAPSTGFLTMRSLGAYDPMGRLLSEQQYTLASQAGGKSYQPQYRYDLADHLIFSTDGITPATTTPNPPCTNAQTPSWTTLTFSNCYDSAGRLSNLNSNLTTNYVTGLANGFPAALFTATSYAAFGGLTGATYGSGLTLGRAYDNRLRLASETDAGSTVSTSTSGTATVTITGSEQSQ